VDVTAPYRLSAAEYRKALRGIPVIRLMTVLAVAMIPLGLLAEVQGESVRPMLLIAVTMLLLIEVGQVRGAARRSAALLAEPMDRASHGRGLRVPRPAAARARAGVGLAVLSVAAGRNPGVGPGVTEAG
jgi:hypothetical protein